MMKLLVSLFIIAGISLGVYWLSVKILPKRRGRKPKINHDAVVVTGVVTGVLLGLLAFFMYQSANAPDTQCTTAHMTSSRPPRQLQTANDYFMRGNYEYDVGNCDEAISDYTRSIALDPSNPQAYNNRAYTYMRQQDYADALVDLDEAIRLKPDYVQALMNRGDIYNYYFNIDRNRAVADYEKIISLGGSTQTSVCGHLFLARHNGWNLGTILDIPRLFFRSCR